MPDIRNELNVVEVRLGEAWEAFAVEKTINKAANKDVDPELAEKLNRHSAFWNTVLHALQTSAILGIYVTVDRAKKSATLYTVLRELEKREPKLKLLKSDLDSIQGRYQRFRHDLYAHNSRERSEAIDAFNAAEFNWDAMERDLRKLDHIWKALDAVDRGEKVPDESATARRYYGHDTAIASATHHTEDFLRDWKGVPNH